MMMKNFKTFAAATVAALVLSGCKKESENPTPAPIPPTTYSGYAQPGGVLVLNQGERTSQNSSITYIAPDGTIEENIYRNINKTPFGNEAQDLYICNGKIYIISNGLYTPNDGEWDGVLVIADAETMKMEKAYKMKDLTFKKPEGSKEEGDMLPMSTPLNNIAVLDEKNIFIEDTQAMYRFDSTTGVLTIIEDAYNFGNKGGSIENVTAARGILKVGDKLYCGGGGFWKSTRLFEFSKGMDKVSRMIEDLKGDFISGLCQTGEREIMIATCGRKGEKKSYLYFIDLDKWEITKEKRISEDISAEFFNTSGITLAGDYIYYAAGTTKIRRLSLKTFKGEDYIDVTKDAPLGKFLNCNVTADPENQYLYVAVSDEYYESVIPANSYLLVYDCSGEEPKLVKNIHNQTCYTIGIFPMSKFY